MYKSNKRFVVDADFIKNASDYKLSLNEFVLLMYFDNGIEFVVNVKNIAKYTHLKEHDIMLALSSLIEKKLVEINIEKDETNKITEMINLDGFYNKIKEEKKVKEKDKTSSDIFAKFESDFGRTLSPNDYQIIKVWLDKLYTEELILAALSEATYNGVSNLRYIDKILYDWDKKGIKNPSDLNKKNGRKSKDGVVINDSLLDYNWLDND